MKVKRKTKTDFGGRWRAWVHHKSRGQQGRPDLKELGASYRQAKATGDADLPCVERLGKAARLAGQAAVAAGARKSSAFGLTQKERLRLARKQRREALWQRTHGMSEARRAAVLASENVLSLGTLSDLVSNARRQTQLDQQERRARLEDDLNILSQFESDAGLRAKDALLQDAPSLKPMLQSATPVPSPNGLCLCVPCGPLPEATAGAAWADSKRNSNLGYCLEREWKEKHWTVLQEAAPKLSQDKLRKITKCQEAGMCLCSAGGKELAQLQVRLLKLLKQHFGPGRGREALQHGLVCVCARAEACPPRFPQPVELWWHIGLMYLSPFRPTFLELEKCDAPAGEADMVVPGRTFLRVRPSESEEICNAGALSTRASGSSMSL